MAKAMFRQNNPMVNFTENAKMSASLVELRVDYHLNRIMKNFRLNNFSNAIKMLPLPSRICEKLIEILVRAGMALVLQQ